MAATKEQAKRLAFANVALEGYVITPEFKKVMNRYWDNEISMLDAFQIMGIDTSVIPEHEREKLRKKANE